MAPLRISLVSLLPALLALLETVYAYPAQAPMLTCDIEQYSTEWFLQNTKEDHKHELSGNAIFYTREASKHAQIMACKSKGTKEEYVTIWDIWPLELYDEIHHPCIQFDDDTRRQYFGKMSEAYARMARSSAVLMHMTKDYEHPPTSGIWSEVEYPTLRDLTDVVKLWKINEIQSLETWEVLKQKAAESAYTPAIEQVKAFFGKTKSHAARSVSGSCSVIKGNALDDLM